MLQYLSPVTRDDSISNLATLIRVQVDRSSESTNAQNIQPIHEVNFLTVCLCVHMNSLLSQRTMFGSSRILSGTVFAIVFLFCALVKIV